MTYKPERHPKEWGFEDWIVNFKDKKIGVIGDIMLDTFVFGDVKRISPEAPIPVISVSKEVYKLGGAANVANNVSSLGGNVTLVGIVGQDGAGQNLLSKLGNQLGVFIIDRPTTHKTRIIARHQQVVRIDKENTDYIDKETENKAIAFIEENLKDWDAVIISDYKKGFITENIVLKTLELAHKYDKIVVGDIKPLSPIDCFKGITVLTPNEKEALEMGGGKEIQDRLGCSVLVTRGNEGMTLFTDKVINIPADGKEALDVVGAGDTVAATLCLALASGASMKDSAILANYAAGIVVGKIGTEVVTLDELKSVL